MTDESVSRTLTHDSFSAISNAIRLDILEMLWMHGEASFTDLYGRIDLEDTGQFSYHLNQLLDQFVYKSDEHYKLTNAGREIVMTVLTHVEGKNSLESPFALDSPCHSCGEEIHAQCYGDWLSIDCASCEKLYASYPVERVALHHHDADDFLAIFDQRIRRKNALVHRRICPNCTATMNRSVIPDAEPEPGLPFVFFHECEYCRFEIFTVPATGLLEHPAVIEFYHSRDIDLYDIPHWKLDWMFHGDPIEVVTDSPLEYTVTIEIETDRLRASLDESGDVQAIGPVT